MDYRELMRRKLLEEMYGGLSEEEKKTFVQLAVHERDHRETMHSLQRQQRLLEGIGKRQNWKVDFLSDVSANFLTDGLIWLGAKLLKRF